MKTLNPQDLFRLLDLVEAWPTTNFHLAQLAEEHKFPTEVVEFTQRLPHACESANDIVKHAIDQNDIPEDYKLDTGP